MPSVNARSALVALAIALLVSRAVPASAAVAAHWTSPPPEDSLLHAGPAPAPAGTLTLDQALLLALRFHPALQESTWLARAASERVREAGRVPNPTLDVTLENFGGGLGTNRRETTISATQLLEWGGRRGARVGVARGEALLANTELGARRREILAATGEAFLDAWWLQERLGRLRRFEHIAATTISAANERTRAGAAPAVEGLRAEGVLAQRTVERLALEAELAEARRRLALQWSAAEVSFDSLALPDPEIPALPPAAALLADLDRHPERLSAAAEVALQNARVREARAARIPDLALTGGLRRLEEVNATGFVTGVSLELPLWNRHGAALRAAEAERSAAQAHERGVRLRLEQELAGAWGRLQAAKQRFAEVRTRMEPAAHDALAQLQRGYLSGRFTYLDQLEGQRAAVEAELLELETEHDAWSARLELERLLGRTLEDVAEGRR